MKYLYILFVIVLSISNSPEMLSQKHFNNWYFGDHAGISFNTKSGEPAKLRGGSMDAHEACSVISDSLGNLLFYTNGFTVWNRLHNTMNNGYYLNDSTYPSTTLIVPMPGSNCQYYIFNENDGQSYYLNKKKSKFNYSILDLSLGDGFGAVTKKNIVLSDSLAFTLAAIGHKNGSDVWIVTVDQVNKKFLSYLLTKDSLVSKPIYSSINKKIDLNLISHYYKSDLKFSPDGKKLALICESDSSVSLYDFNNQTGEIINEIMFSISNLSPYSLEFSNNSKLLYLINATFLSNSPIFYLNQYDISSNDPIKISNSEYHIFETEKDHGLNDLQMGPNKKIYTFNYSLYRGDTLMVINNPDLLGKDCDFKFSENITFTNSVGRLPTVVQNYIPKKEHCIYQNITVCEGSNFYLYSPVYFDVDYKWIGPNKYIDLNQHALIFNSKPEMSGTYYYKIFRDNVEIIGDSINVTVIPNEKILFEDKSKISICKDEIELTAVANPDGCKILWEPLNVHDNKVIIKNTGKYTVYVENKFGCIDSATIDIRLYPPVRLKISSNGNKLCKGDVMLLSADQIYSEYLWSTGDTTHDIVISKGGKYFLKVKSDGGCEGIDSITIEEFEKPIVEFEKSVYVLCKGDSLILNPLKINPQYEYVWSDGYLGIERIIKEDANLFLIAKLPNGCVDTAFVMVGFFDVPVASIIADKTEACLSEKIKLTAKDYNPKLNYLWSNGQKGESITVAKSGTYNLMISAGNFCSDTTEITVQIYPDLALELLSDNKNLCFSDSIKIYPKIKYDSYQWSTGETTESITVRKAGTYQLIVKNSYGCSDTAVFKLDGLQKPVAKIIADKTEACFGEKITLNADNFNPGYDYNWSNAEKGESITVTKSGTYSLIVSNGNLCADTTQIDVKIYPDLALEILADNTNLCFGDSTRIYPKIKYDKYLWSTGDTTETITVRNTGIYQLIVQNNFGCSDTAQITITNYNAALISDPEYLTFNELCIGSSETKNIKFTLISNYDMTISSIYLKSTNFNIDNINNYLKSYKDGETFELPITFKPLDAGEFTDTLVIESGEPCHYKKSIPIYGTSKALFQFSLPNIISQAGNYLMIPIYAGMTCPNSDKLSADYEIDISFDKEYFIPDSVKFGTILENKTINQNRFIRINWATEFNEKKDTLFPINYIYGLALVGRKEIVPLTIDSVNFTNKRYYPEYINGSLKIEGCVNNIRPIQLFKPTTLSIAPNPTDGDIKLSVETQEKGTFKIEIFNLQGQSIYKKEFSKSNSSFEEFDYFYDTKEMGSGVYSVHLTSPWNVIRKQLVISK